MKTRFLAAATLVSVLALGTAAFAADNSSSAPYGTVAQMSTDDAEAACTAAKDPPRPIAIVLKGIAIVPSVAPNYVFGGNMVGSCVGTAEFVSSTQPFRGISPFPVSWWQFQAYPLPQWYGTL